MSIDAVESYLQQHADRFVTDLAELLRIPSVSADSAFKGDVRRAAEAVRSQLEAAGLQTEIAETPGHPIVCGHFTSVPGAPTLLIYGHYDVQPPDPLADWITPAFEPTIRDGKIYARGATDDKGQMLTHIKAIEAWTRGAGQPPINVKVIIEGEEEVGSSHLEDFLAANKERLACDVVVVSDTSQYAPGVPAITYGLRGIIACEVTVRGPKQDLHSGVFGGAITNPVNGLARLIASLHDEQGNVQIPEFYHDVSPLTPDERDRFSELPFDQKSFYSSVGVQDGWGEESFTSIERRWARPTCDVNGITGGYQGEGPKTIIPSWARAKITCRLVPKQDPQKIVQALEAHLRSKLRPGLEMEFTSDHGAAGLVFDTSSPWMQAASKAIAASFGTEPVYIREGGSIPIVKTFQDVLGVDTLLLGWGQNTDNLHSPNEHFSLEDFQRGIRASARLMWELSQKQNQ